MSWVQGSANSFELELNSMTNVELMAQAKRNFVRCHAWVRFSWLPEQIIFRMVIYLAAWLYAWCPFCQNVPIIRGLGSAMISSGFCIAPGNFGALTKIEFGLYAEHSEGKNFTPELPMHHTSLTRFGCIVFTKSLAPIARLKAWRSNLLNIYPWAWAATSSKLKWDIRTPPSRQQHGKGKYTLKRKRLPATIWLMFHSEYNKTN